MCLDISFYSALELLDEYFPALQHDDKMDFDRDMGVHVFALAYRRYPVITYSDGRYHLKFMEWCIIAPYMDTPEKIKVQRTKMGNMRTERIIGDKTSFWYRNRKNRCLIPVTSFFEHRHINGWKNKVPYDVSIKGRDMFCIPGEFYYNTKIPPNVETGEVRGMFSLGTRDANEVMRGIHNDGDNKWRMPLMVPKETELKWLDPELTDTGISEIVATEIPSEELSYYPVRSVRSKESMNYRSEILKQWDYPGLPPLGNDDPEPLQKSLF
ncbi:MAG: SOS response-associated peptidase family protein [Bacteroidetes bacterium]|nr:SOS response-associated peptidase family protein [Bacteroidota bacterium]